MPELGGGDPWRESLERSLVRRGKSIRSAVEPSSLRAERDLVHHDRRAHEPSIRWLLLRWVVANPAITLLAIAGGILTLAVAAAALPSSSDGRDVQASARVKHTSGPRAAAPPAPVVRAAPGSGEAGRAAGTCQTVAGSTGYVNPLAGAVVSAKRIDQGVDYAGWSGTLTAIGAARLTEVATSDTGWPGAFIEYQLADGPAAGCYVFYAEGVTPMVNLQVGETVRAGQPIATIIPGYLSGIEIGWGAGKGTETYAAAMGEWSARAEENNIPTVAGNSFSALIASLGGPPGKVEG